MNHFNPEALPGLMCRSLLSVGYDGRLYDCDFNQMLDIPLPGPERSIFDLDDLGVLADRPIAFIWGLQDWCFRTECLDRFLEIYPDAEVHRFGDAGHYVVEDAHERIVPIVRDFLARHPLRGTQQQSTARPAGQGI